MDKPNGLTIMPFDDDKVKEFLAPLDIRKIWGVGAKTAARLHNLSIMTIGQLQRFDLAVLQKSVGENTAQHLKNLSLGIDSRAVREGRPDKSISKETTFSEDVRDREALRNVLIQLTEEVCNRMRRKGFKGATINLKLRWAGFQTITRQMTMSSASDSTREIRDAVLALFDENMEQRPVRLIGMGVSKLIGSEEEDAPVQLSFFEEEKSFDKEKEKVVDSSLDALREKFGKGVIKRGLF